MLIFYYPRVLELLRDRCAKNAVDFPAFDRSVTEPFFEVFAVLVFKFLSFLTLGGVGVLINLTRSLFYYLSDTVISSTAFYSFL